MQKAEIDGGDKVCAAAAHCVPVCACVCVYDCVAKKENEAEKDLCIVSMSIWKCLIRWQSGAFRRSLCAV